MAKNFSPEVCADIVIAAFQSITERPETHERIIAWYKKLKKDTILEILLVFVVMV